ncbi:unnamed protein product [Discosporangium mesarthrocarpum]
MGGENQALSLEALVQRPSSHSGTIPAGEDAGEIVERKNLMEGECGACRAVISDLLQGSPNPNPKPVVDSFSAVLSCALRAQDTSTPPPPHYPTTPQPLLK